MAHQSQSQNAFCLDTLKLEEEATVSHRKTWVSITLGLMTLFAFQNCGVPFRSVRSGSDVSLGKVCGPIKVGTSALRRLNREEIQNSLTDLLYVSGSFVNNIPEEAAGGSGFINDGASLLLSDVFLRQLSQSIEAAVAASLTTPNSPLITCSTGDINTCAKTNLTSLATLAYRRPLSVAEQADLSALFDVNIPAGLSTAVIMVASRIFLSPNFLFVTSFGGGSKGDFKVLSAHELAARLSLFLWNSVPDKQLLDLATSGKLRDRTVLRDQVKRLLLDPRAKRFSISFFRQWLGYMKIADDTMIMRDNLTSQLRQDMIGETEAFLGALVNEDKSPIDLITADYTYLNASMASHYGIGGVSGGAYQRVSLPATSRRRGLFTQASILTLKAHQGDSAPIQRGHYLLEQVFCEAPPPPPFVPPTISDGGGGNLTVKQMLAAHSSNPSCAGCHAAMDPIGISFENFDQLGKFRFNYPNGQVVDSTGSVFDQSFQDYVDIVSARNAQWKARSCVAKKIVSYAVNRRLAYSETCAAEKISEIAITPQSKFSDLIVEVVASDLFHLNDTDSQ